MPPNWFLRYVLSPLATLILIAFTEYLYRRGYNISLGLPLAAMSLCLFWSGLKGNIISALFITAYGLDNPIWDTPRLIILILTVWPIAIGGGLLKRWLIESVKETERQRLRAEENQLKADFVDSLNGNILFLREINSDLIRLSLAISADALSKEDTEERVRNIQDKTADLAQRAIGWQQLAEAKKIVKGEEE